MRKINVERNIPVLMLNGDSELSSAIGIKDKETLARYRKEGMPYYPNGNSFLYDPKEVVAWLKTRFKKQEINPQLI